MAGFGTGLLVLIFFGGGGEGFALLVFFANIGIALLVLFMVVFGTRLYIF